MPSNYDTRREYGDSYLSDVRKIVATHFEVPSPEAVRVSSFFEDTKCATDLVTPAGDRIGVRIRSPQYAKYKGEFTVRTSGADSEYHKLQWGAADYIFYSFEGNNGIAEWWLMRVTMPELFQYPIGDRTNGFDSSFKAFTINPTCVVACGFGLSKQWNAKHN